MKLKTILTYLAFSLAITHVSYGQVTFGPSVPVVSALPATCTAVGSSSSSSSVQYQGTFYYCSATNTWTAYGSGGGGGTPAGSSGDYQINNGGSFGAGVISQSSGRTTITPTAASSGVASYHRIITPADTTLTASTESIGAQFGGNTSAATVTRQWATGALATQRENVFVAPTIAFAGASTLTTAVNLEAASPIAGTNATLTNSIGARFVASSAAHVPLVVKGAASQTGNLFEAHNSSGILTYITSTGDIRLPHANANKVIFYFDGSNYKGVYEGSAARNVRIGTVFSDGNGQLEFAAGNNTEVARFDSNGLFGINKSSSLGAQLHTLSGSASRISGLFEGAASNSVAVLVSKQGSSGTGDGLQIQNSSGTVLAAITSAGRFQVGASGAPVILSGTGAPESAVTAPVGSVYLRTDGGAGTSFCVKESGSGNTGWACK